MASTQPYGSVATVIVQRATIIVFRTDRRECGCSLTTLIQAKAEIFSVTYCTSPTREKTRGRTTARNQSDMNSNKDARRQPPACPSMPALPCFVLFFPYLPLLPACRSVQNLPAEAAAPWATLTWAQYHAECLRCAEALRHPVRACNALTGPTLVVPLPSGLVRAIFCRRGT